ncbi:MAG: DJ-1/PfpI family protein [Olsenella sp.]|nr:DJ-1/PfpI family protein [Olsenella sp.]
MFEKTCDARVAVFFAEGLEECEALVLVDLLFRAGIPCDKVAVGDNLAVTSSHDVTLVCDRSLADDDFSFDDYDMLVLPGGMPGTKNLRACEPLCDAVSRFVRGGRPVAAICAAPSILAELGLLEGRRATANPNFQHVLAEHGAVVEQDAVVQDGNVMTSKGLGTALELGLALVRHFLGDAAVEDLKEKVVYIR